MPGTLVRETRSTTTCPDGVISTPHCSRFSPVVFGTVPTVISTCEPSTVRPSVSSTETPFSVPRGAGGPAALQPATARLEDLLEHLGGVGVLSRQHPVARGDEGDRHAGLEVPGGELRAGDAGADDDEVLGHLLELVDVAPVEDPVVVGLGAGQHARVGAGGDEDGVALQLLDDRAVVVQDLHAVRGEAPDVVGEPARPVTMRTPSASRRAWMSADWAIARPLTRWLTDARSSPTVASSVPMQPEDGGVADRRHRAGGGDERLGRDAVGEHAGAADAVPLDDGDLRTELRGDQRRPRSRPVHRR